MVEPYSEEWLKERFDACTAELVKAIDVFLAVDKEDIHAVSSAAGWISCHSRNLSGYAGDLASLSSRKYWGRR